MLHGIENSARSTQDANWLPRRSGVTQVGDGSQGTTVTGQPGDQFTPGRAQSDASDAGLFTVTQFQFVSIDATFVLGPAQQSDPTVPSSTTSTDSSAGTNGSSSTTTDSTSGASAASSSGLDSNALQGFNTALAALGLSQQQIQDFDQVMQLINSVSSSAADNFMTEIEALAQQVGQGTTAPPPSTSSGSASASGTAGASSSSDAPASGSAGSSSSASSGTTGASDGASGASGSSSSNGTHADNSNARQTFNNALASFGLSDQQIQAFDHIVRMIHKLSPSTAANLVHQIDDLAQTNGQGTTPVSTSSSSDGSGGGSGTGPVQELKIQFSEIEIQGNFNSPAGSQTNSPAPGSTGQSSSASGGSSFEFVAFKLQIDEITGALQSASSATHPTSSSSGGNASDVSQALQVTA